MDSDLRRALETVEIELGIDFEVLVPKNLYDREKVLLLVAAFKKYNLEELTEHLNLKLEELI